MSASCVYEGVVRHRRHEPVRHAVRNRIAMVYLDLDEPAPRWLRRRSDHLAADDVRALAGQQGPVRVLTRVRAIGRAFNPVRLYYCFDAAGERVEAVVAEVTNTPWGERHAYVLAGTEGEIDKDFHVSPFLAMDHRYAWRTTVPGDTLLFHIAIPGTFDATLTLHRRPLGRRVLWRGGLARPRIYLHALRLRAKGAPTFAHP